MRYGSNRRLQQRDRGTGSRTVHRAGVLERQPPSPVAQVLRARCLMREVSSCT
jgi:hypothetical protein